MTIERASFPDGFPIQDIKSFPDLQQRRIFKESASALPAGEYNITPQVWTKNVYTYRLIVSESGTATIRLIPRFPDSMARDTQSKGRPVQGGRIIKIPEDQDSFYIIGPHGKKPDFQAYEAITYTPGLSPTKTPETPKIDPEDEEIITGEIRLITQARRSIVENARKRVTNLKWNQLGITSTEEIEELFKVFYPLVLRNSGQNMPLNLLIEQNELDSEILRVLPVDRKSRISEGYWLAMIAPKISPSEATFIRDWIYMKIPEVIAKRYEIPENISLRFMLQSEDLRNTMIRTIKYLQERKNEPQALF